MHMYLYYVRNHNETIIKAWVIFFGWGTREQGAGTTKTRKTEGK